MRVDKGGVAFAKVYLQRLSSSEDKLMLDNNTPRLNQTFLMF
jgi:hypothetical protein